VLLAALRRFTLLLAGVGAVIAVLSLGLGALLGAGAERSLSLGFVAVGTFLLLAGIFVGNRGPVRITGHGSGPSLFGAGYLVRWATPSEREETLNLSAVVVVLGVVLLVIGLAVDPRYSLF
jgi:hypothetical protein